MKLVSSISPWRKIFDPPIQECEGNKVLPEWKLKNNDVKISSFDEIPQNYQPIEKSFLKVWGLLMFLMVFGQNWESWSGADLRKTNYIKIKYFWMHEFSELHHHKEWVEFGQTLFKGNKFWPESSQLKRVWQERLRKTITQNWNQTNGVQTEINMSFCSIKCPDLALQVKHSVIFFKNVSGVTLASRKVIKVTRLILLIIQNPWSSTVTTVRLSFFPKTMVRFWNYASFGPCFLRFPSWTLSHESNYSIVVFHINPNLIQINPNLNIVAKDPYTRNIATSQVKSSHDTTNLLGDQSE